MKKGIAAVIALAAAAGISIGAFLAVRSSNDKNEKQKAETKAKNVLVKMDTDKINSVTITINGETYAAALEDDKWVLTDQPGEPFVLNQSKYTAICTYIANLTAVESYGELTEENINKYGFNDPFIITASDGESENTLYVGAVSPTGQFYYAYTDEKKEVFVVPASSVGYIIAEPLDLKTDKLLPYSDKDIVGITVVKDGKTAYSMNFNTEENMWEFPEKYSVLTVNQTRPSSIISVITRLTAEEMIPESDSDMTTYGFDKPDAELIITAADGTKTNLLIRYYGKDAKTYVHVYNKQDKQTAKYFTGDFDFLNYEMLNLILPTMECANMYAIDGFELNIGSLSEKFVFDNDNGKVTCRDNVEIDLNNAEIKSFFENFYNSFAYISVSGIDIDTEPEMENELLTSSFMRTNGIESKYSLVDAGNGQAYIFVNGKYTGTLTDTEFLTEDGAFTKAYDMLCRHLGIEQQGMS